MQPYAAAAEAAAAFLHFGHTLFFLCSAFFLGWEKPLSKCTNL